MMHMFTWATDTREDNTPRKVVKQNEHSIWAPRQTITTSPILSQSFKRDKSDYPTTVKYCKKKL